MIWKVEYFKRVWFHDCPVAFSNVLGLSLLTLNDNNVVATGTTPQQQDTDYQFELKEMIPKIIRAYEESEKCNTDKSKTSKSKNLEVKHEVNKRSNNSVTDSEQNNNEVYKIGKQTQKGGRFYKRPKCFWKNNKASGGPIIMRHMMILMLTQMQINER